MGTTIGDLLSGSPYSGDPFDPNADGFEFWDNSESANARSRGLTLEELASYINDREDNKLFQNAADYVEDSGVQNGGEAIQKAVTFLGSDGGIVFIPSNGPDDGVATNGKTLEEDSVWKVTSSIVVPWNGVTIIGEAHGTMSETQTGSSGTRLLVPDSASVVDTIFDFRASAGSALKNIRLDGGTGVIGSDNVRNHVILDNDDLGGSTGVLFRFLFDNVYMAHSREANIRIDCGNNTGNFGNTVISRSTLTDCGGANILIQNARDFTSISVNSIVSSLSEEFLRVNDQMNNIKISQLDTGGTALGTDVIVVNDVVHQLAVSQADGFNADNSFLKVTSNGSIRNGGIEHLDLEGGGTTPHIVDNQGQISDFSFRDIYYQNLTGTPYVNVKNDIANTTRVLFNNLGYNGANDPASSGDWNGNGEEGVRVLWDNGGTPTISEYIDGTWYDRAL